MSKMDTEVIATAAFKLAISKTDLLSPFVNEKDKEPSWDGHIYIYSDKRKTKENIKRVPVQVKGEAVNRRKVKEHITHDIDYDDLMAYLSDGGAIYVVVYIDETTGEPLQIYYISLLPEKIKNILKKENKGKSQRFKKFPSNKTDIEDLFLTFYTNSKQQVSFAKKATIPPDIFAKRRDFTGFSFNLISSSKPIAISELPKYLEGKDLTLYGHLRNVDIPIPVDYIDEVHDVEVTQQVYTPISVNGIKYYDTYSRCYFKDKIVLQIGSCITITINEGEDGKFILPYQVDYKVVGTLSERIKGLNFVMAAIQNKGFSFGEADFSFNDNDEGFKSFNMDNLVNTLNGYKKAKQLISKNIDSLFAINDTVALGVIKYCQDHGINIPHDLKVAGYDDLEIGSMIDVPLTTVHQRKVLLGRKAAELLLQEIKSHSEPFKIVLAPKLTVRSSCGEKLL